MLIPVISSGYIKHFLGAYKKNKEPKKYYKKMLTMSRTSDKKILFFASALFLFCLFLGFMQPYFADFARSFSESKEEGGQDEVFSSGLVVDLSINATPSSPESFQVEEKNKDELSSSNIKPNTFIQSSSLEPIIHTVQPGETLSSISIVYFHSARYWKEIYKMNKDVIPNKNKIKPGLKIKIPRIDEEKTI